MEEKSRVLVVDDESSIRNQLSTGLTQRGFETESIGQGFTAMERIEAAQRQGKPHHCVVLDIRLPDVDGLKVLEMIKARYPDVGVVVISGFGSEYPIRKINEYKGSAYLDKPFELDALAAEIARIILPKIEPWPEIAARVLLVHEAALPLVSVPKDMEYSTVRVETVLPIDRIIPARIDPDRCAGCRICQPACPSACLHFDAERKVMVSNSISCKGCGTCVSVCPSGVPKQARMADASISSAVDGALRLYSGLPAEASAGKFRAFDSPRGASVVRFFSEEEAEPGIILEALEAGFDGVLIGASNGSASLAEHRRNVAATVRRLLEILGISEERVAVTPEGKTELGACIRDFGIKLAAMGPNPIRPRAV